jgi:hypothetical protein
MDEQPNFSINTCGDLRSAIHVFGLDGSLDVDARDKPGLTAEKGDYPGLDRRVVSWQYSPTLNVWGYRVMAKRPKPVHQMTEREFETRLCYMIRRISLVKDLRRRHAGGGSERAVPAGGVAIRSRAASGISVLALQTRLRGARWTGIGRGRVTPAQTASVPPPEEGRLRQRRSAASQEAWPEVAPRDGILSRAEPRWNADRRAHPEGCAAVPAARHEDQCVCRRSASFIYCLA